MEIIQPEPVQLVQPPPREFKPLVFRGKPVEGRKRLPLLKGVIHGAPGAGKSELLSQAMHPFFLDLDGNLAHLAVPRERLSAYDSVIECSQELIVQDHDHKMIIVDSLGTFQTLALQKIHDDNPNTDWKFGSDYKLLMIEMIKFRNMLDQLAERHRANVFLICHSELRASKNPEIPCDRYHPRLNDKVCGIFYDWSNCFLYMAKDLNKDMRSIESHKSKPMSGNTKTFKSISQETDDVEYVIYTNERAGFVAKNVFNLPYRIVNEKNKGWQTLTSLIKENF